MHYLEAEFKRLVKYAQGLGIKVSLKEASDATTNAAWLVDGSEIIVYNMGRKGPLQSCLDLIHELSHHMAWVYNGRKGDLRTDMLLGKRDSGNSLTKPQRKVIYEMEKKESGYQHIIHKEIGSKIPIARLLMEVDYDVWIYWYWYVKGIYPNRIACRKKLKELRTKHGLTRASTKL